MENIAEAEVKRKTCGNIKGEVSGKMKSCHLEIMRVARELQARNRVDCGSDIQESLQQLRAEAKAPNNRLKQLEEDKPGQILCEGETGCTRKEVEFDNKTMGKVLTELSRSVIQIQQELWDMKTEQGSYAQVAARPRVAPSPPMTKPLITVPDGDGFIEVRRINRTATPAGGPQPTRDVRKDDPPGRLRVGGGGLSAGPQQNKKKKNKKKKTRRIRETAAVSLTCAEGASYLEALKKLETGVNLGEIEAKGLSYKRGLTGSFIWQVRGRDANVRADRLAQAMKGALPEARIARPQRTSTIKLVGIYLTTTLTTIRCGLQEVRAGFDPNLISMGECPLVPHTKGRDIILGGVADRQGKSGCAKNVSGSAGEKTILQGDVNSAGVSVNNEMEVEQASLNHARRAQDLLGQRMREIGAELAIVSEPWWVPPRDEKLFSSLGGSPLSAIVAGKGERTCSLVRRGLYFVAVKWGDSLVVSVYFPFSENLNSFSRLLDELEELLGTFPAIPALVAGDLNARFPRWDPEGRSNPRSELLCMNEIFPKFDARAVEEDRLAAALVSGEWIRDDSDNVRDLVRWVNSTLLTSCDMSMSRVRTTADRGRVVPWARRGGDPVRIRKCLEDRREKRKNLVRAIRRAKALAWRDFNATIEDDPWGRPYRLVMGKLGARGVPLTEALDPHLLERIVATLFPEGGRSIATNVEIQGGLYYSEAQCEIPGHSFRLKTVSFHAAMMVAGIIPLDHLAPQLAEAYKTRRNAEGPVSPDIKASLGAFARIGAIAAWKEEKISLIGVTGETGVRVNAAIAGRLDV
ncbi:hypothetical protein M0804_015605 [Polistes exclamans]|nr:hypothetical protein M0804_015605 [Polistes exclamans]